MSTDEHSLAQWLDAPTSDPEGSLDPEVLEAVYALRPDLAPAPRVSADDILASITEGPLAADAPPVPSSLPSPEEAGPTATPAPANRSLASWGGWGGIGLAMAAAATFALVGLPVFQASGPQPSAPVMELDEGPGAAAPAAAPTDDEAPVDTGAQLKEEARSAEAAPPPPPPSAKPRARPAPAPSPRPAPAPPRGPAAERAYDMTQQAPLKEPSLIPELDDAEDDAVAAVADPSPPQDGYAEPAPAPGPDADSPPADAVEAEEARRLDDLRATADSVMRPPPSWKSGLAANEVQRLEAVFAEAATLSPMEAGDKVAAEIRKPHALAHHTARLAADYYVRAGNGTAAAGAAMRGLQIESKDGGWAGLALFYGDLVRGSDPDAAADWYEKAAAAVR